MNDEEKKVLELLRMANELMGCILDDKQANIILNLIEKLQKENEEYHRIKKELIRVNKKIYDVDTIDEFIETIEKLQKENKESKELYNKLLIGYNKLVQEYLELEKENQELKEVNKKLKEKLHEKNERIIELNKLLEDKE